MNFTLKDDKPLQGGLGHDLFLLGREEVEDTATMNVGEEETTECGLVHQPRIQGPQVRDPTLPHMFSLWAFPGGIWCKVRACLEGAPQYAQHKTLPSA